MKSTQRQALPRFDSGDRVKITKSTRRPNEFGTVRSGLTPPPSNPPLTVPVRFDDGYVRWYHPAQLSLAR